MNSAFSEFFRNASHEEKERVWREVMQAVAKEQMAVITLASGSTIKLTKNGSDDTLQGTNLLPTIIYE